MESKPDTTAAPDSCGASKAEPCHHMERYVGALADGSLTGPARLYTKFHVATCPRCAAALRELQESNIR